jgi:hypothetical protein
MPPLGWAGLLLQCSGARRTGVWCYAEAAELWALAGAVERPTEPSPWAMGRQVIREQGTLEQRDPGPKAGLHSGEWCSRYRVQTQVPNHPR